MWIAYALASAFFAGITAVLAKVGVKTTPSSLATALRTIVVLAATAVMVAVVGSAGELSHLSTSTWLYLVASGLATGASWLCYFRALKLGPVGKVAVIDKSSIVITVLLAMVFLGEVHNMLIRLAAVTAIGVGTWLMVERSRHEDEAASADPGDSPTAAGRSWVWWAFASALCAALTAVFGKVGIHDVESNLGTAIRTVAVLVMAWLVVVVRGELPAVRHLSGFEALFIALSGLATGASWLCYWKAMQDGPASIVAPLDKLSIVVTIGAAALFFGERQSRRSLAGLALLVAGTLGMVAAETRG